MTPPKSVKCKICGKRFRSIGALSHHRKLKHPNAKRRKSRAKRQAGDRTRVERSPREIHVHVHE